jgi:Cys-rich protein (TIGR01571 family)
MGEFQYGLCSCFGNCMVCVLTYFVPCYVHGKIAQAIGENCLCYGLLQIVPIANFITAIMLRGKVRDQKGIDGSGGKDCATIFFCYCCAVIQEAKEVNAIDQSMSRE